jgi:hypothetical protein
VKCESIKGSVCASGRSTSDRNVCFVLLWQHTISSYCHATQSNAHGLIQLESKGISNIELLPLVRTILVVARRTVTVVWEHSRRPNKYQIILLCGFSINSLSQKQPPHPWHPQVVTFLKTTCSTVVQEPCIALRGNPGNSGMPLPFPPKLLFSFWNILLPTQAMLHIAAGIFIACINAGASGDDEDAHVLWCWSNKRFEEKHVVW